MNLPLVKCQDSVIYQIFTKWKAILDPVIALPQNNSSVLKGVTLSSGSNVINHKLGKTPQGWIITDLNASATVYRSAPFNPLTLTLTASSAATVNIEVF